MGRGAVARAIPLVFGVLVTSSPLVLRSTARNMWCGKEVRVPRQWAVLSKEILKEKPDPELVDIDGMIKWIKECDIVDESVVRAYEKKIKPYHFVRLLYPHLPKDKLCLKVYKIILHFVIALYCSDDRTELECDLNDVLKICDAYEKLKQAVFEMFPKFPTIEEMQSSLKFLSESKLISPVVMCMDFVNKVTSCVIEYGDYSEAAVLDFRRRFSNTSEFYLQGLVLEKEITPKDTENKTFWRRILNGGPLFFFPYVEIASFSLEKLEDHIPTISEMYIVSSFLSILINDQYSYNRETLESINCDSVMKQWLSEKKIASMEEAVEKVSRILNACVQYMFEKVQRVKLDYPNSPEVHVLYEYIAELTVGWLYIHEESCDRYKDSPWRVSLIELEEDKIQEWLSCKDSYGFEVLNQFLASNPKAKKIIDALSGDEPIRGELFR